MRVDISLNRAWTSSWLDLEAESESLLSWYNITRGLFGAGRISVIIVFPIWLEFKVDINNFGSILSASGLFNTYSYYCNYIGIEIFVTIRVFICWSIGIGKLEYPTNGGFSTRVAATSSLASSLD